MVRKKGEKRPPGEDRGQERLAGGGRGQLCEQHGFAVTSYMMFIVGLACGARLGETERGRCWALGVS